MDTVIRMTMMVATRMRHGAVCRAVRYSRLSLISQNPSMVAALQTVVRSGLAWLRAMGRGSGRQQADGRYLWQVLNLHTRRWRTNVGG